ncbi:universal stress protein [Pontibacter fetidus]|uniref:Universal stress protein n=1 Tax=Pontibacter fetidus TaxID=2700082 RepID=A0A6B2H182_9BACT|nr:universal stress protein [Pontibacter fetidus]NDK54376.1 universal stress protein [Pontibacter fetidus]
MDTWKKLLVTMDYSRMDEIQVCYTAFLCRILPIGKVYFVYVRQKQDIPKEVLQSLNITDAMDSHPEALQEMQKLVQHYFSGINNVYTEVLVKDGHPVKELLKTARQLEVDLFVTGRKLRLRGSGILSHKLVHTGDVSVLLIPETAEPKLEHIVVSIDFSEYSKMTLAYIQQLASAKPELRITCLHVYEVPTGYITLGVSYEEFDTRTRHFAEDKFGKMMAEFPGLEGRTYFSLVRKNISDDTGEVVVLEANRARADLLVVGARGMSGATLLLMGSVTEKIIRKNDDIPLLVIKKKNENLGFLDALIG